MEAAGRRELKHAASRMIEERKRVLDEGKEKIRPGRRPAKDGKDDDDLNATPLGEQTKQGGDDDERREDVEATGRRRLSEDARPSSRRHRIAGEERQGATGGVPHDIGRQGHEIEAEGPVGRPQPFAKSDG